MQSHVHQITAHDWTRLGMTTQTRHRRHGMGRLGWTRLGMTKLDKASQRAAPVAGHRFAPQGATGTAGVAWKARRDSARLRRARQGAAGPAWPGIAGRDETWRRRASRAIAGATRRDQTPHDWATQAWRDDSRYDYEGRG